MRRMAVLLLVLTSVLGVTGTAQAGGPTSVLLASPTLGTAAALYNSGEDYARLAAAVGAEGSYTESPDVPSQLGVGPGSAAINVTWLAHDVWVWRVDRVQIEPNGKVWVNTLLAKDNGEMPVQFGGVWHQAEQPKELIALLTKLGVWDGVGSTKADPENAIATGGEDSAAAPPADEPSTTTTPAAATSTAPTPWLYAAIALLSITLGLAARPALTLATKWRARGPRQQLIDA